MFSKGRSTKTIFIKYLILDVSTSYNILLGCLFINNLGAIILTLHLVMKFLSSTRDMHVNQKMARECYIASLQLPK